MPEPKIDGFRWVENVDPALTVFDTHEKISNVYAARMKTTPDQILVRAASRIGLEAVYRRTSDDVRRESEVPMHRWVINVDSTVPVRTDEEIAQEYARQMRTTPDQVLVRAASRIGFKAVYRRTG